MLYSQMVETQDSTENEAQKPIPVFLHGFLGSSLDWDGCLSHLDLPHAICIDLPCHGLSKYCEVQNFEEACQQVQLTILSKLKKEKRSLNTPLVFVAYSLGARIAMFGMAKNAFPDLNVQGAIFEGGNFGLNHEEGNVLRWENDKHWSKRFATEAIEEVLFDWYEQGVFSSLNDDQRQELVELRSDNLGSQLGCMLRATSLSKQPYLLDDLKQLALPLLYICGEHDQKFRSIAENSGLAFKMVQEAGHNVHHEQPQAFAALVSDFIDQL
ncbi:2-succinyl-6-hydroxy-2,4-cyclohexadiene-1-carboxylate synthase [Vibrio rumoiensis]|uniref:Putative 2-succinyl-6-hydroxy-2,4-cyclohexadiene-1-carboxylate synthase n=1 Tax=Vibrio rumoiensis 1S-45 TaxID=1188252 RepID=A0A1E5E3Q4_9VIBR|nr:2-succinyl-6-hydroxy-2,4-cyclohexadiene-1-carboxylate synthase [Vibrio rumoiensis]OEF26964.1 2-succinyl-6-hydroxy-2,4-cyclohexadiene-1-carboxylate synthase [Vibrio rumoiensis 1S-45]